MEPETAAQLVSIIALYHEWRKTKSSRQFAVHPINARRKEAGQFHALVHELKDDAERFRLYTRMSIEAFDKLLGLVGHRLEKRSGRESLGPEERLIIFLRFLSTGDSYHALSVNFRIGISTACNVCHEEIADGFYGKWQLPNALGAIDGKHVVIKAPANTGSLYYNYKQHFSTVLMIIADHRSRIVYAHFGSYGRESDAGIYDRSDFKRMLDDPANPLDIRPTEPLPGTDRPMPFYFIGDGAFGLHMHMQRPFPGRDLFEEKRIYNYRISRARRVVESTFGIMAGKWRILLKAIETTAQNADIIVKAICCLHNYLVAEGEAGQYVSDEDMAAAESLRQVQMRNPMANHPARDASEAQNALVEYFNGLGSVEWQWEMI